MVSSELSDQKPGISSLFRALLIFLLAGGIVAAAMFLFRHHNTYDADRSAKRYENLKKLKEDNAKKVAEYAVLDKDKGLFQLPVKEAIALTARDLSAIGPHSAYPVATPPPPEPPKADAGSAAAPAVNPGASLAPSAPAPTAPAANVPAPGASPVSNAPVSPAPAPAAGTAPAPEAPAAPASTP